MSRPNYNAAKRARELKQKAKREAKLARRQSRGHAAPSDEAQAPDATVPGAVAPSDQPAPQDPPAAQQ